MILNFAPHLCIVRQQAEMTGGASGSWPPSSLLSAVNSTFRGTNNLDKTLDEFLLHVQTDQQRYFVERLKEYEAMLHLVGLLAGAIGTEEEQEAARSKVMAAIEKYIDGLEVSPWSVENPIDIVSPGSAIIASLQDFFGYPEAAEKTRQASRITNTIDLNMKLKVGQVIADLLLSIWNSMKKWWDDFWKIYETEGLLIAMNRLKIDVAFFAAECAIDVAITFALAGAGAAVAGALKGLRFVGKRVGRKVTRIAIHAIPDHVPNPSAVKLLDIDIIDEDIAPNIDRIMNENRFGGAGPLDDTVRRAEANAVTPNTTIINGQGRNTATINVDPDTNRPRSVSATIMDDAGANPRGDNATEIGRLGNEGDHGGHLIAHRFMGDVPDTGIVPQAGNLNTGAWKKMENEWADWINKYQPAEGNHVEIDVNIDIDPPGAVRPDRFDVEYSVYEVDASGNRTRIHRNRTEFENQPGESFDRVYFRTDGTVGGN